MKNTTDPLIYLHVSLPCVNRLLGLLDRNPYSSTYGCFDRNYWHYKIVDFSNGRLQEASLTLALLYTTEQVVNPFYKKEKVREWSLSAMHFLETIQNSDGSFNEYYPHEHAFVTTAFATFAVSEGLLLLNERPSEILEMLERAGRFLVRREELEVVNQNLGACAALQNLYTLTNDEKYQKGAKVKLESSLKRQSEEGWFYEYGGPDIGYLSVAVYYLAHYYKKTKDEKALASLKKALYFLSHFLHPDGTAGGEYGSRNTTYLVPDGIEICAQHDAYASFLSEGVRQSLYQRTGVTPFDLDDRYLCNMLYTYVQAFRDANPKDATSPESCFFPEAGLLVKKTPEYYFVANLRKGGVFKVFSTDTLISDSGFLGRLSTGSMVSSQWLGSTFTEEASTYHVTGRLVQVPEQQMTPVKTVVLRTFLSFGREYAADFAKNYLRKQLITQRTPLPLSFERIITLKDGIHIKDTLRGDATFTSLHIVDHASLIFIPSSRYFLSTEVKTPSNLTEDLSREFNKEKEIVVERHYLRGDLTASTA